MPVSNEQAQQAYLAAREALDAISRSRRSSDAQKRAARRERERLDLDFIGQSIANVDQRTAKFQEFVANMQRLVDSLQSDALLRGMKGLTDVLAAAGPLVGDDE